ncbi:thiamine pyrophosphate-dependent dehydrogenase E1 component subunit alpha [Actinoallomurus sp. NPDC050550]|uniref:thiamine pyrophosphate-dependent dehydrogenase E1 component subunit alpha n=1 Tax=Actinoallomurus sp. NPDC050550 TaxID=3154937 RepID=UPI0033F9B464
MDRPTLLRLHKAMVMSRAIETFCMSKSPHWYAGIGEEATVVGAFSELRPADVAVPHYRGSLVIPWLRGAPLKEVLGRVIQRRTSATAGRLYGQFSGDLDRGVLPFVTLALGPNLATAVGVALAVKRRAEDRVVLCSFGDGTAGTGDFHESLNLAATLRVPVVFVCQNNQIAISTPAREALATESVTRWARGYGLPTATVDGNDVTAVANAVQAAVDEARTHDRPTFVEAVTYRMTGHFHADPAGYQSAEEREAWRARDPIDLLEARMEGDLAIQRRELRAVWEDCTEQVRRAADEIEAEPSLTADDLGAEEVYEHVC